MRLLLVAIVLSSVFLVGCEEIKSFFDFENKNEKSVLLPPEPELSWEPDRSKKFIVSGKVKDFKTNAGLANVEISAEYTIACPTTACEPFHEEIQTKTNASGEFALQIYQQFWDITFKKQTFQFQKIHITKEETNESQSKTIDIVMKLGVLKDLIGYVRDQGKQIIIDRGGTGGYSANFDGEGHYYTYLVVVNDKESETYKQLLSLNNKEISFKGYLFPAENKEVHVELVSFTDN